MVEIVDDISFDQRSSIEPVVLGDAGNGGPNVRVVEGGGILVVGDWRPRLGRWMSIRSAGEKSSRSGRPELRERRWVDVRQEVVQLEILLQRVYRQLGEVELCMQKAISVARGALGVVAALLTWMSRPSSESCEPLRG